MGLDPKVAPRLAEGRLDQWRRLGHHQWRTMVDQRERRDVTGADGRSYLVVSSGLDDGDGGVRIVVAVDDGGWSAVAPVVRDEISRPGGSGTADGPRLA